MIVAEFIASQRTMFGIPHAIGCRALQVSQSWFYKWINHKPTARQQREARLDEEIKRLFTALGGTYGSPRVTWDLREAGWKVSKNTVPARMAELGLCGRRPKQRRGPTRAGRRPAAPDLVRRKFTAVAPDVLWCGDVTQIDTCEGALYLATVEDLLPPGTRSRHVRPARRGTGRGVAADGRRYARRGRRRGHLPHRSRQRIHRGPDHRCLPGPRRRPVDGAFGCALDNAAAEAFNSTLKVEFVHRQHFTTRAEARIKVSTWIADFYNTRRRHSANDGLAPIPFERHMAETRGTSKAQLRVEVA